MKGALRVALIGSIAVGIVLSSAASSFAQNQGACGPNHRLSPADHERVVAAIINDAPEVAKYVDYQEITRENQSQAVIQAALRASGIPEAIKRCLEQVRKAPLPPILEKIPDATRKEAIEISIKINSVRSIAELKSLIAAELKTATQKSIATGLRAANQILESGEKTIYNSNFYVNAVKKYRTRNIGQIAKRIALDVAIRDASGGFIGGVWGFFAAGPEGALAVAVERAVQTSAGQVMVVFAELWFGVG